MLARFVQEQKRYTQSELGEIFCLHQNENIKLIKRLKEVGVLKVLRKNDIQKDLTDLSDTDLVLSDVLTFDNENYYVFKFVGVIMVHGVVIKCYPKYIESTTEPTDQLKQILKVISKYNDKKQIFNMYNDEGGVSNFNLLSVMVTLINDYYEYGLYDNSVDVIETNGSEDILWDKTVNEAFTLISNNRPFYPDLFTRSTATDEYDYIRRLHAAILSKCSKELYVSGLLELFDLMPIRLSDEDIDDFGDQEYILYQIAKEINNQYISHKQLLLKLLYAYIFHNSAFTNEDHFSLYGTSSFELVWQETCSIVLNNQLYNPIRRLDLPNGLRGEYKDKQNNTLISLIEKPMWYRLKQDGTYCEPKESIKTLEPDVITVYNNGDDYVFWIFDAKYYKLQLEEDKPLVGYPGIESITKQYLYHLAYDDFLKTQGISTVRNCFVFPKEMEAVVRDLGYVKLDFMQNVALQNIRIIMFSPQWLYEHYLKNIRMDLSMLEAIWK